MQNKLYTQNLRHIDIHVTIFGRLKSELLRNKGNLSSRRQGVYPHLVGELFVQRNNHYLMVGEYYQLILEMPHLLNTNSRKKKQSRLDD